MDLLHLIALSLIQGFTEFLPISSSAHLILPSVLLGWRDQGLVFDIAVHIGSLIAVILYLYADIKKLLFSWLYSLINGESTAESRLCWCIIISTIPAGLIGLTFASLIELHLRTLGIIAAATIIFGLALGYADFTSVKTKKIHEFTWKAALLVGLAQSLALIPGASRSGVTITAALLLGFERTAAAKFSFLLAIPIIFLSGLYKATQIAQDTSIEWGDLILATLISFLVAYTCINLFISLINRVGMMPFVIYRLILGIFLIAIATNI